MRTENMSRNGLLIVWNHENGTVPPPSIGQIVTTEIELPAHHGFGPKCIHCQGAVVRVEREKPEAIQVAMRLNYMDFRSLQSQFYRMQEPDTIPTTWTT